VFGLAAGFLAIILVSLVTHPPDAKTRALIDEVRYPVLRHPR
jgi:Na+(H+)/acetate symporter ActP